MNLSRQSLLLDNIARYGLDSRIGKSVLFVKGTGARMGERVSMMPGRSPVVMDYRYYEKGDPLKDIDWKLSARTEKLFVKIREGYRQTDFVIAPDCSGSMRASYGGTSKFITALTLSYIAGRVALKSGDRVFISFAGENIRAVSAHALLEILAEIEVSSPDNGLHVHDGLSSNLFILSDFFSEMADISGMLRKLHQKTANIFMISIHDTLEETLDLRGKFRFFDPEADASLLADAQRVKDVYRNHYNVHYYNVLKTARSFGVKSGRVHTDEDPYHAFVRAVS